MKNALCAVGVFLLLGLRATPGTAQDAPPDRDAWLADITFLDRELRARHVDLFHQLTEHQYEASLERLRDGIQRWNERRIAVELARFVASIGDGHTSYFTDFHPAFSGIRYPLRFYVFEDGLRVLAAPSQYAAIVGKRVVAIDGTPIAEIYRRAAELISADNWMEFTYTVPDFLAGAPLMATLGLVHDADSARFSYQAGPGDSVAQLWVRAHAVSDFRGFEWEDAREWVAHPPSLRLEYLLATPFVVNHFAREEYWYTVLPDRRALFLQYNTAWDAENGPPFAEVARAVMAAVDSGTVERIVIDLRNNAGGEPLTARPLIDALAGDARFRNRRGSVIVLVGRRTFSAALTNALELRREAGAVVIGERPRGKPNNPSEGRSLRLPRSGLEVTYSSQLVVRDAALGDVPFMPVDVAVPVTFRDHVQGVDRALDVALAYPITVAESSN